MCLTCRDKVSLKRYQRLKLGFHEDALKCVARIKSIKSDAIDQLINDWKRTKDWKKPLEELHWGDEIDVSGIHVSRRASVAMAEMEYMLVSMPPDGVSPPKPYCHADKVLDELHKKDSETWKPEYASYMVEGVKVPPLLLGEDDIAKQVLSSLVSRRRTAEAALPANVHIMSLPAFPTLGAEYTHRDGQLRGPTADSIMVPDDVITPHVRFQTLTKSVRARKGAKVAIAPPLYKDVNTISTGTIDFDPSTTAWELKETGLDKTRNPLKDRVYLDATVFGFGQCCLQCTFEAPSLPAARILHDQMCVLAPLFLALSAAAPFQRGMVTDVDARYELLSQCVDDRTIEEADPKNPEYKQQGRMPETIHRINGGYPELVDMLNKLILAIDCDEVSGCALTMVEDDTYSPTLTVEGARTAETLKQAAALNRISNTKDFRDFVTRRISACQGRMPERIKLDTAINEFSIGLYYIPAPEKEADKTALLARLHAFTSAEEVANFLKEAQGFVFEILPYKPDGKDIDLGVYFVANCILADLAEMELTSSTEPAMDAALGIASCAAVGLLEKQAFRAAKYKKAEGSAYLPCTIPLSAIESDAPAHECFRSDYAYAAWSTPSSVAPKPTLLKSLSPCSCQYISTCAPESMSDLVVEHREDQKQKLMEAGMDEVFADYFAYIFYRDPMIIFQERIHLDNEHSIEHFEGMHSTHWTIVRIKPPPAMQEDIHWRVELRTPDVQITDYENAAIVTVATLLARAITRRADGPDCCAGGQVSGLIPISKLRENMLRSQQRDALRHGKFWWNNDGSIVERSMEDIWCSPGGLLDVCRSELKKVMGEEAADASLDAEFINFIEARIQGKVVTGAQFLRRRLASSPNYHDDSVITPAAAREIMELVIKLGEAETYGDLKRIAPEMFDY
ncbi:hypothetical protein FOL47_005834 [Perkinsus chesapeaki]|uniref:Glutamate--cysteine ligase n=1 Tax=Perkinsus chesapeaki TaxID=330153 RepID=A0A7J6LVE4_PERCH|nr:hypothetical protein FOL47_005834 [Perkinsus chesapeaki]